MVGLGSLLVMLISLAVFFAIGWTFLALNFYKDFEVRNESVKLLFSLTFTLSCALFELIIFEIGDFFEPLARRFLWKSLLYATLVLVIVILPLYQVLLVSHNADGRFQFKPWAVVVWIGYLYFFYKLGKLFPIHAIDADEVGGAKIFFLDAVLGRVGLIGVTMMAVLSGFGAVNSPFSNMFVFMRAIAPSEVAGAERRWLQTINMLASKKKKLLLLENNQQPAAGHDTLGSKMMSRWRNLTSNLGMGSNQLRELTQQIKGLESMQQQLFFDYEELLLRLEKLRYSKTWKGHYFNVLGHIFSLYCIYKIIISIVNIVLHRIGKTDPVTHALTLLVHWVGLDMDVAFWTQQISFVFVGLLVFFSIYGLLTKLSKFFQKFSTSMSPNHITLFLAQIMGMYFLSNVLMLRSSLPFQHRRIITDVLSNIEFQFYHLWFDAIFLVSAIASILFLYLLHQIQQDKEIEGNFTNDNYNGESNRPPPSPYSDSVFPSNFLHRRTESDSSTLSGASGAAKFSSPPRYNMSASFKAH